MLTLLKDYLSELIPTDSHHVITHGQIMEPQIWW